MREIAVKNVLDVSGEDRMKKNRTEELLKEKLREKRVESYESENFDPFSVLEQNKGRHLTAEDIYELVTQEHPEIGLATVYRTIQLFMGYAAHRQD